MLDKKSQNGQCLCGAVKFVVQLIADEFHACHCLTCRTWGGGPFMAIDCGQDIIFHGADNISIYNSSQWAERGFCSGCGTHLFYRLKSNNHYEMPIGLFAAIKNITFSSEYFIEQKPHYYDFKNNTQMLTGQQLFAQYEKNDKS